MYVLVNNKQYKLYTRADGSQFYRKDGKRVTLRVNQKTTSRRSSSPKRSSSKKKSVKRNSPKRKSVKKKASKKSPKRKKSSKKKKKNMPSTLKCLFDRECLRMHKPEYADISLDLLKYT